SKRAVTSNCFPPIEENAAWQGTAFCRLKKSRWGSTARLGFWQNHAGTRKTCLGGVRFRVGQAPPVRVFVKITPGREKPVWVELTFALGKHHPRGFLEKSRQGKENLFGWRSLSR
ncbi:MAG: hypothetical protein K2I74_09530, partial [Treponemataceae bacterium]|nr:hypothetical protein [Treponemataceae bacterium]